MTKKNKLLEFDLGRLIPILKIRSTRYDKTDSVYVSVVDSKTHATSPLRTKIRIKITEDIIDDFNWKAGDGIMVYHDPDFLRKFYFIKSPNGYTLSYQEGGYYNFEFPWVNPEIKLDKCAGLKVEKELITTKTANILSIVI